MKRVWVFLIGTAVTRGATAVCATAVWFGKRAIEALPLVYLRSCDVRGDNADKAQQYIFGRSVYVVRARRACYSVRDASVYPAAHTHTSLDKKHKTPKQQTSGPHRWNTASAFTDGLTESS